MKKAVLSMFYNESMIAPYFLNHYKGFDEIRILFETDTDDNTKAIIEPHVNLIPCHIEGGIDDIQKVALLNAELNKMKGFDWVFLIDSDEFILWDDTVLYQNENYNLIMAAMYQVYRHRTDKDLDPLLPPIPQRVHGDPDLFSTTQTQNKDCNAHSIKPSVIRPGAISFLPGNHVAQGNCRRSPDHFFGAHWQMADPSLAIARRLQRKARISDVNRQRYMGFQHWNVSPEWILEECERHLDDPIIRGLA